MSVLKEFHTKVVGTSKKNDEGERIQKLLEDISDYAYDGMPLELEHESDNEYDENAIKVYCDGDHIGYLKKELAAEIVDAVDEDCVEAEMAEITGGDGLSFGCNILLRVCDAPVEPILPYSQQRVELPPELVEKARAFITTVPTVDTLVLQKALNIRYSTASALIDKLEEIGDVGPLRGTLQKKVYTYDPKDLRKKAKLRIPYAVVSALYLVVAILSFFVFPPFVGFACIAIAGIFALQFIKAGEAAEALKDLENPEK